MPYSVHFVVGIDRKYLKIHFFEVREDRNLWTTLIEDSIGSIREMAVQRERLVIRCRSEYPLQNVVHFDLLIVPVHSHALLVAIDPDFSCLLKPSEI